MTESVQQLPELSSDYAVSAEGTRIAEPTNEHQPADLARWLMGGKPGEKAASPLNPLLYHRSQSA